MITRIVEHSQIGKRFGKCVFDSYSLRIFPSGNKKSYIYCVCDCGYKFKLRYLNLNPEKSYSCKKCKLLENNGRNN